MNDGAFTSSMLATVTCFWVQAQRTWDGRHKGEFDLMLSTRDTTSCSGKGTRIMDTLDVML